MNECLLYNMNECFLYNFKKLNEVDTNALICDDEIYTWKKYYELSLNFAKNLQDYNCQKKSVAIFSKNCPKYYISIMGIIMGGSIFTGVHPTCGTDEINYILDLTETEILCVQNYDTLNSVFICHPLKLIILFDDEPVHPLYKSIKIVNIKYFFYNFNDSISSMNLLPVIEQSDIVNYIFTSSTTGKSKCIMRSIEFYNEDIKKRFNIFKWEKIISYLPSSHAFDLASIFFTHFVNKGTVYFSKKNIISNVDDLLIFIEKVEPTMLIGVPRIWEKINEKKEWKKIEKCKLVSSAGILSQEIERSFLQNNIKIFNTYGSSENGLISANDDENYMMHSVGKVYTSDLKISPDGEILVKNIFNGYKNDPIATVEFKDADGWLHTGDCGIIKNGFLFITGRKKEIIVLSTGKKINPNKIEEKIKILLPNINNVVVVGNDKKFLSLLIFNTQMLLTSDVETAINYYNLNADYNCEKIQKFLFINSVLTVENGFLTRSLKMRRGEIVNFYSEEINSLYN